MSVCLCVSMNLNGAWYDRPNFIFAIYWLTIIPTLLEAQIELSVI